MPIRRQDGKQKRIDSWEGHVEQMIREARERGEFDNLPGAGKPLDLSDNPFAGEWQSAFRIARNAGAAPLWVELDREIAAERERLREMAPAARATCRRSGPAWSKKAPGRRAGGAGRGDRGAPAGPPGQRWWRRLLFGPGGPLRRGARPPAHPGGPGGGAGPGAPDLPQAGGRDRREDQGLQHLPPAQPVLAGEAPPPAPGGGAGLRPPLPALRRAGLTARRRRVSGRPGRRPGAAPYRPGSRFGSGELPLQQAHVDQVVPAPVDEHLLPEGALDLEADLLVGPHGALVVVQDAQVDLVQLELGEGVAEGQAQGLRPLPPSRWPRPSQMESSAPSWGMGRSQNETSPMGWSSATSHTTRSRRAPLCSPR